MLRICYCLSHFHPIASGAERQAHLQGKELVRCGHEVHVITRHVDGCAEQEQLNGIRIWRLIRPREIGPLFGVTFLSTLASALRRLRDSYDLVHCHQGLWEAVAAGWVLPRLGKPSVVQPAAGGEFGEVHQWSETRGRGLLRRAILRNSHFVAISGEIEQELAGFGVPATKLSRLASGVDTELFSPGPSALETQLPPRPRVLFLGRLHVQKNLDTLLAAWPAVRRRVAASLILAGDGPLADELNGQANKLGVTDSVHFVGAVRNPIDYLRAADVFVLPSIAEGMSNSLLEAMAVGLPVVASRIGGNDELICDDTNGRLLDPKNVHDWSREICDLVKNPTRARQFGQAARAVVSERFSIRAIVDRYVALYERMLGKT